MHVMEQGDLEELSQLELAKQVGEALNKHYPDHPWIIGFQGGGIVIRHLGIAGAVAQELGVEGFSSLLPKNKLGTPKEIEQSCVTFGGAMLEAFGLKRGKWHGEDPMVPTAWKCKQRNNFT